MSEYQSEKQSPDRYAAGNGAADGQIRTTMRLVYRVLDARYSRTPGLNMSSRSKLAITNHFLRRRREVGPGTH